MSHGRCFSDEEHSVVLEEAHNRWRRLSAKRKAGKAPAMQWCYDCDAWHLVEPAFDGV